MSHHEHSMGETIAEGVAAGPREEPPRHPKPIRRYTSEREARFVFASIEDRDAFMQQSDQQPNGVVLSGRMLKELLEFVNPDGDADIDQLDEELRIVWMAEGQVTGDENEPLPTGYYACLWDYPEEGWLGPLGDA